MKRINVVRKTTCFFPGTIQLPLMKMYLLDAQSENPIEWAVIRNFHALNIIDYRLQLKNLTDITPNNIAKSYNFDEKSILFRAENEQGVKAIAELLGVQEGVTRNVDRFYIDSPVSELIIFQYYFDVDSEESIDKNSSTTHFEIVSRIFERIVNLYVKSTGDWTISSFSSVNAPIYYETSGMYFDKNTSRESMRKSFLSANNQIWSSGYGHVNLDGVRSTLRSKLALDSIRADEQVSFASNNPNHHNITAGDLFTKIARDIYVEKNYKYALLESFTFAETFVTNFLTDCKIQAGISKTKINDFEKQIGISYKLNVELPIFLRAGEKEKGIIAGVESIRRKRNDIIHGNKLKKEVSKEDALEALKAVRTLFEVLISSKSV